ncbi:glycosyl hydrolase family 28-related protein [Priestia megaterium]
MLRLSKNKLVLFSLIVIIILLLVVLLNKGNENEIKESTPEKKTLSVSSFGANGSDGTDDTSNIQHAIDYAYQEKISTVYFPKGTYLIDALKSIHLRSNTTVKFEDGTVLKALPNESEGYHVIAINDAKNISLKGKVVIQGERNEHKGTTGEWGMGVSIRGSENIKIENSVIRDNWGDGIYIGGSEKINYSKNIKIINPELSNNRRQGISVISAINLEIINPKIMNTNGTPPAYGIDLEPNSKKERLQDIRIINPYLKGNQGGGILIFLQKLQSSNQTVDIKIVNQSDIYDNINVKEVKNINGSIQIINSKKIKKY